MHMADALLTPAVAGVMYAASAVVAGASIVELHKEEKQDLTSAAKKLPTMAVMSALVFAGQMINYTIPGTGSVHYRTLSVRSTRIHTVQSRRCLGRGRDSCP